MPSLSHQAAKRAFDRRLAGLDRPLTDLFPRTRLPPTSHYMHIGLLRPIAGPYPTSPPPFYAPPTTYGPQRVKRLVG